MNNYFKYLLIICLFCFSVYYTKRINELSLSNNEIMVSINEYASIHDYKCNEGYINEDGVVLGHSGLFVDKNKSLSYMKGIGFKEELVQYKKDECILNLKDNYDKYIISGNKNIKSISIVINVIDFKYIDEMVSVFEKNLVPYELLVSKDNILEEFCLFKGSASEIKDIKNKNVMCTNMESDILSECSSYKINSIKVMNHVRENLIFNIKNTLENGNIYFIDENYNNSKELSLCLKYIKSRGFDIVKINKLLE